MQAPGTPLPLVTADEVIARLEQAKSRREGAGRAVIVFDADGTIWGGDIGNDTFEALLASRGVLSAALPALQEEARSIRASVRENASDQASVLFDAFRSGSLPHLRAFAMMAWAFAGHTPAEVRAFAAKVVDQVDLAGRVFAEVRPILKWSRESGVPLYVVSASPVYVVEEAVAKLELPVDRVFGMTPRVENGRILPAPVASLPYGEGKAELLAREAADSAILGAFGDSAGDLPMLGLADVKVAVGPRPALVALASALPDLIELSLERGPRP